MFAGDATPEEIQLFLAETDEQLETLDTALLRLERQAADPGLLQEIFRIAHTIKGSSAAVGLDATAHLTHAMENLLDDLRNGRLAVSSSVLDALLQCLDTLRAQLDAAQSGREPPEVQSLIDWLAQLAGQPGGITTDGASSSGGRLTGAGIPITMAFDTSSALLAARQYQVLAELDRLGTVVDSLPTREELERFEAGATLEVLFTSELTPAEIEAQLRTIPDLVNIVIGAPILAAAPPVSGSVAAAPPATFDSQPSATRGGGTVRIDVERLDTLLNLVGELVIDRARLLEVAGRIAGPGAREGPVAELFAVSAHIERTTNDLRDEIMRSRMLPIANVFRRLPRVVRDLAQHAGKEIDFVMEGEDTELDRSVIDEIPDPLIHLLRNAVDHGVEPPEVRMANGKPRVGTIRLSVRHEEGHIVLEVSDDGRGIDAERLRETAVERGVLSREAASRMPSDDLLELIFMPGFSTARAVSEVSGRGVGMDIVRAKLERVNGSVSVETTAGGGTRFILRLPLTLAIIRALLVDAAERTFAIPLTTVIEVLRVEAPDVRIVQGRPVTDVRGELLPLVHLGELLELPHRADWHRMLLVVAVRSGGRRTGVVVDGMVGEQEVVIKSLGGYIGDVEGIAGTTILGDGRLCPIVDVPTLLGRYTHRTAEELQRA